MISILTFLSVVFGIIFICRVVIRGDTNIFDLGGLQPDELALIPVFIYTKEEKQKEGSSELCSICLGDFDDGECCCQLPSCGHQFHLSCIKSWFFNNINCPNCRMDIRQALIHLNSELSQNVNPNMQMSLFSVEVSVSAPDDQIESPRSRALEGSRQMLT
jgi:hypothetical protein